MTMFDPALAELHAKLFRAGVPTVLAGGCCRDLLFGYPPKDYDFFVLGDQWTLSPALEGLAERLADPDTLSQKIKAGYSDNTRCGDVWEFQYKGLLVNVIFPCLDGDGPWESPEDCLDHFDTTLNLAWYSFDRAAVVVDRRCSYLTRKVQFRSEASAVGPARTAARYARLHPRFPDLDWSEVETYLGMSGEIATGAADAE